MKSFVTSIWNLLGRVHAFKLTATTKNRHSFFHNAKASGKVKVFSPQSSQITFHEAGSWTSIDLQTVDFRNVYNWSLSEGEDFLRLTHLRYGTENPVHLVDFVPLSSGRLQSVQPHICGDDRYSATLSVAGCRILLNWTIQGPSKNDTLDCLYLIETAPQESRNGN